MAKKPDPNAEDDLPEGAVDQSFDEKAEEPPKGEAVAAEPDGEPEKEEKVRPVHNKRQEVYKRLKAQREAEEDAGEGSENPASPYAAEPEKPVTEVPAGKEEPEPEPEPKKIKLKVNGQEVEKTEEEVAAAAQQHYAAEDRLPDIKQLRGELQNALAEIRNLNNNARRSDAPAHQPGDSAADTDPAAPTKAHGLDPKKVREVFEKIRLGDGDEGVEEFSSLLAERQAAEPSFSREEVIADVLQIVQRQAAIDAASNEFAGKHQEVFSDVRLSRLAAMELADLVLDEFKQIGVSQQDIAYLSTNPSEAIKFHKKWREEGHQLSSAESIAEKAIANVQTYRPAPAVDPNPKPAGQPSTRTEARTQEKRTDLQNQPRRASAVARQAPQQPKTTPEVVSGIRAMRGFRA